MATSAPITGARVGAPENLYSRHYRAPFLDEVEAWLARTRIAPTRLGWQALGDYRFVRQLREGRDPASRTIAIVRKTMREMEGC